MVHVLPQANYPFEALPLDNFLKTFVSTERKTDRRNIKIEGNLSPQFQERLQRELAAKSQGLVLLPEFPFKHAVYQITEQVLSAEGLQYGFKKCASYLKLKEN